jgi:hypothetical protein
LQPDVGKNTPFDGVKALHPHALQACSLSREGPANLTWHWVTGPSTAGAASVHGISLGTYSA